MKLESQPYLLAKLIKILLILLGRVGQNSPDLHRTSQEYARLEAYHLDVFSLGDVVTCLKIHVILLTFAYLQGRFRERMEHILQVNLTAFCHAFVGKYQHRIAAKNGRIGVPSLVNRLMSAAHLGVIHQVIVQQCVVMIGLQGASLHENRLRVVLI